MKNVILFLAGMLFIVSLSTLYEGEMTLKLWEYQHLSVHTRIDCPAHEPQDTTSLYSITGQEQEPLESVIVYKELDCPKLEPVEPVIVYKEVDCDCDVICPKEISDETAKPNSDPVGAIYLLHIPKTAGTFVMQSVTSDKKRMQLHNSSNWKKKVTKEQQITMIQNLRNQNWNNKVHVLCHHHNHPNMIETLDWLIPIRDEVRAEGYQFDIIITFRDPDSWVESAHNYYGSHNYMPYPWNTWVDTVSNPQIRYIKELRYEADKDWFFRPWEDDNGDNISEFNIKDFMVEYEEFLEKLDFIFITSQVSSYYGIYLNKRWGIELTTKVSNVSKKSHLLAELNMKQRQKIIENNILDYKILEIAHKLAGSKMMKLLQNSK